MNRQVYDGYKTGGLMKNGSDLLTIQLASWCRPSLGRRNELKMEIIR